LGRENEGEQSREQTQRPVRETGDETDLRGKRFG
jgi:hypothetical protein